MPWLRSSFAAMLVFATLHQVLVAWAPVVFVGLLMAPIAGLPVVVAYASIATSSRMTALGWAAVLAVGLSIAYGVITISMWGRTFEQGPREPWSWVSLVVAPLVVGVMCAVMTRSIRASVLGTIAAGVVTIMTTGFQQSEPDLRNVGAHVCLVIACFVGGWNLDRSRPAPAGSAGQLEDGQVQRAA